MEKNEKHNLISVTLKNGNVLKVPKGITLLEFSEQYGMMFRGKDSLPIVAGKVDNDIKELNYTLENDCKVEFIDLSVEDGLRIYRRSLIFIMIKAVKDLYPERRVIIGHALSKGIYCEIKGDTELTEEEVKKIEKRMHVIVDEKIPFIKREIDVEEAEEILKRTGRYDRLEAIEYRTKPYATIYNCGGTEDYFYGYMVPHTGYINKFSLVYYKSGMIVLFPHITNPYILPEFKEEKKLFSTLQEYKKWGRILGVENIGNLNRIIKEGGILDLINVSEALHEKKIAQIADMIANSKHKKKIALIAGPSSSGKTTFAQRLSIQLRVNGIKPVTISLDDYFVDREHTPKDEYGEYDYEALEAIDIKLFNKHLRALINGEEVEMPVFDFYTGCRACKTRKLKIDKEQIIIIEGIHGLNEKLTYDIPKKEKFKIYISALTSMNIDDHNRIPSTDTRYIRRIVRDYQFRNSSPVNTIKRWPSVRRGEEQNIFPFQETADVMFNSFLIYELGVMKTFAEELLSKVDRSYPEYSEAKRLIEFLSYFLPIEPHDVPSNSILREFIGGSCF
ncbi:MAG TPA: nucleoside kinase [Clostridiaceae bacterium]|nr:nucleoside kinase [Clostridiaceae bacterium]